VACHTNSPTASAMRTVTAKTDLEDWTGCV
jgi:hypothetical protein